MASYAHTHTHKCHKLHTHKDYALRYAHKLSINMTDYIRMR